MQVSNSFCSWSLILCVCVFSEMLGELARKEKHGSLIQSFYSLFTVLLITVIGTHISRSGCRLSHASS
uniref:Uncharacterized protein n=1 Tax=Arundo donax TaxID=35708 RepID=A0A0A9KIM8_ARUDO